MKFIPGSNDFQILERDNVIVTGTATVPDNKLISTYSKKTSDKTEDAVMPLDLKTEDLYKDFRLKGFEYGPAFQVILGSDLAGECLKANGYMWQ